MINIHLSFCFPTFPWLMCVCVCVCVCVYIMGKDLPELEWSEFRTAEARQVRELVLSDEAGILSQSTKF